MKTTHEGATTRVDFTQEEIDSLHDYLVRNGAMDHPVGRYFAEGVRWADTNSERFDYYQAMMVFGKMEEWRLNWPQST